MLNNEIDLSFNYVPVNYGKIKTGDGEKTTDYQKVLLSHVRRTDKNLGDINFRLHGKIKCFTDQIVWDDDVLPTITANGKIFRGKEKTKISKSDIIIASTFPEDYDFNTEKVGYICGMSVPPLLIKRIVTRLIESGVFNYDK